MNDSIDQFVPERQYQQVVAERDMLQKQLAEKEAEAARLRDLVEERNAYIRFICEQFEEFQSLKREDLLEMERNGVTGEQLLTEIDAIVGSNRSEGSHD
jgi:hypothetical protein